VTGNDLAKYALGLIGAYSSADGDAPAPADAEIALVHANLLRKSWNAQALALHAIEIVPYTWPSATASRTVGPTGQLLGTRPLAVLRATVVIPGTALEAKVDVIEDDEYADIADKTLTGDYMTALKYEANLPTLGTITVWPIPTAAVILNVHNKILLGSIVDTTDIVVPEAYEAALVSQLAKRLAPIFGKSWTAELNDIAHDDWTAVKQANIRVPGERAMPAGFPGTGSGMTRSRFHGGQF
jgi:hypothetical protein